MNKKNIKTAVITGAAGDIGLAIVTALLQDNYTVALLDRNEAGLHKVTDSLSHHAQRIKSFPVDVTNEQQVTSTMINVANHFGRLDVLINNAGILNDGLLIKYKEGKIIQKLTMEQWQSVIDINLTGVFLCGREAATQMIKHENGGTIINMTSLARQGNFGQSSYSAAKAGVAALTVTWAQELARYNIRSAGIAPGVVDTQMVAGMKPEALEKLCKQIPSGRLGTPKEIAVAVKFILENKYFNGRILETDGGLRF
ncbi:MAG: SDR family oxidoreductase [Endozoicomonadaceae bacterium]|nr:SDR family oxidoreductase [Endozoicomonadaceae bacterium]MCY4329896.1 SDR family oxidoreductase [Endozoicomonadaceae bacterium]